LIDPDAPDLTREIVSDFQHRLQFAVREAVSNLGNAGAVAEKIGVSVGTLYAWQKGSRRHPDNEQVAALARVADMPIHWITGR
jgi:DNA-binding transcriptional regulator YiaG